MSFCFSLFHTGGQKGDLKISIVFRERPFRHPQHRSQHVLPLLVYDRDGATAVAAHRVHAAAAFAATSPPWRAAPSFFLLLLFVVLGFLLLRFLLAHLRFCRGHGESHEAGDRSPPAPASSSAASTAAASAPRQRVSFDRSRVAAVITPP